MWLLPLVLPILRWALLEFLNRGGHPPLELGPMRVGDRNFYLCLDLRDTPCNRP